MSEHRASLSWKRATPDFAYDTYDRTHTVSYSGGASHQVTAAPEYKGDPALPDPEELLVASLSSCHMLTFLAVAARSRLTVDAYEDEAVGVLEKNDAGKLAVTRVTLRPKVTWAGDPPSDDRVARLHDKAHANCMIANSVLCSVEVDPRG